MKQSIEFKRNPRSALLTLAFLSFVAHTLSIVDATPPFPAIHRNLRIALAVLALALVGAIQALSTDQLKRTPGKVIYFLLTLPILVTNWLTNSIHLRAGVPWEPYRLHSFIYITLGILVPISPWLNFVMIILFTVEAVTMWFVLRIGTLPNAILTQQPVLTILWVITSCVLLYTRAKDQALTYELSETRAKNEVLKSVARVFLTLRDRANTPLQTLEVSAALLEKKFPETIETSSSIRRSVTRLSEINQIMAEGAAQTHGMQDELLSDDELKRMLKSEERKPA